MSSGTLGQDSAELEGYNPASIFIEHYPTCPEPKVAIKPLRIPTVTFERYELESQRTPIDLVALIRTQYYAFVSSTCPKSELWTWKKAAIEVLSVRKAFPLIDDQHALMAMTAWFHFLCTIDDLVEGMTDSAGRLALQQSIRLIRESCVWGPGLDSKSISSSTRKELSPSTNRISCASSDTTSDTSSRGSEGGPVVQLTQALIRRYHKVLAPEHIRHCAETVISVLQFMHLERGSRMGPEGLTPEDYLCLRTHTIGLAPFFAIIRCFLCSPSPSEDDQISQLLASLCSSVTLAVGLQNDIVGLEKDMAEGEQFNMISLLVKQQSQDLEAAFTTVIDMHNKAVDSALTCWTQLTRARNLTSPSRKYADCLLGFLATHYAWATHSRRYQVPRRGFSRVLGDARKKALLWGVTWRARMVRGETQYIQD